MQLKRVFWIAFFFFQYSVILPQNTTFQDSISILYKQLNRQHDSVKLDSLHVIALKIKDWQFFQEAVSSLFDRTWIRVNYCYQAKELNSNKINKYLDIVAISRSQSVFEPIIDEIYFEDYISLSKVKPLRRYRKVIHGGSWDENITDIGFFRENNLKDTATLLLWTGLKYYDYENHRKAKHYFEQAIKAATTHSDLKVLCAASSYYSAFLYEIGDYLQALPYASKTLQLSKSLGDTLREAAIYNNLGEILYKLKMYQESNVMFCKALYAYQKLPGIKREAIQMVKLGKSNLALKEYLQAQNCFNNAIVKGKEINDYKVVRDAYYYKSLANRNQGNIGEALYNYQEFVHFKDSLFTEELDLFVKERENYWQNLIGREISKKEYQGIVNKMNTIELNRTRTLTIVLISMSGLLLLLMVLGYRAYSNNKRANRYLHELNQTRNKFFSIVSHDLRGPLTGFVQLLTPLQRQSNRLSKEQILEHTKELNLLAGKTLLLLDNLLKWANLQRGYLNPVFERFAVSEIINFNVDLYCNIAKAKNINLVYSPKETLFVYADKNMVDTIIRNLLNNAIKFTPEGGFVWLSGCVVGEFVEIKVTDNGIGIPANDIKKIFDFEHNIIQKKNTAEKGSGLGLLLAREFVEKNKGKIWVESQGQGMGSTFTFTLRIE